MRLFVAVWPTGEVVDALHHLDRPAGPGVRWSRADQWHVTLRFLGEVSGPPTTDQAGPAATDQDGPPGGVPSGLVQSGPVQSGPVQSGPVQSGPVQSGLVQSGLVQSGPVQSGCAPVGEPVTAAAAAETAPAVGLAGLGAALAAASVQAGSVLAQAGPRVRALGPELLILPVGGLGPLADAVTAATAGFGRPPDWRPFLGHITVARARRGVDLRTLAGGAAAGTWPVTELCLVASTLRSDGAGYTTIATYPLGGVTSWS